MVARALVVVQVPWTVKDFIAVVERLKKMGNWGVELCWESSGRWQVMSAVVVLEV